jgi:hypothetical protein
MKNMKNKFGLLLLLAGVFALDACNKEEDPFTGTDSYITAFVLQQDDAVFHAAIAGATVTITAPEGFSLAQAKASVTLSENATIYPDPAAITGWEDERQFVVTARNGAQIRYKYTVARSGIAHSGTVVLETQADVNAFGAQGITFIDGSLIIGRATGTDSITSLAPLADLKEVVYGLTLQPTCAITSLDGLGSLEHVGGTLQFGGTTYLTYLNHLEALALPALKTAGGISLRNTVTVEVDLPELTDIVREFSLNCPIFQLRLPNLQRAGTLTFVVLNGASTSLEAVSLPALEEADYIAIDYLKGVKKIELPQLKKIGAFRCWELTLLSLVYAPRLEEITGEIYWRSLPALTEASFPALTQGSVHIEYCAKLRIMNFPKLTDAPLINLYSVPVKGLSEFPALQTADRVELSVGAWADRVDIPAAVQRIGVLKVNATNVTPPSEIDIKGKTVGELYFQGELTGVKLIGEEVFHGTLSIYAGGGRVPSFDIELDGFREVDSLYVNSYGAYDASIAGIRKVHRGAYFAANYSGCPSIFGMPDMEEIGGDAVFDFRNMPSAAATDTIRLEKLKRVGGNLSLSFVNRNIKVLTCPELETVGGDFSLNAGYTTGFESLLFPKLSAVDGKLTINTGGNNTNTRLTNLDGFAALTRVQAIEIIRMVALTDYTGLQELFKTLPEKSWIMPTNCGYMPTWQDLKDEKWTKQ